tara:strand:+ start:259 stop:378 length:120 start_codon:yes stop_codon:yes gene_type:complete
MHVVAHHAEWRVTNCAAGQCRLGNLILVCTLMGKNRRGG